jgi:hypothetical protein
MSKTNWTHKVRKESRGIDGQMHQMPTAITGTLAECEEYAERFASEQREAGVGGMATTRIVVMTRGGKRAKSFAV